MADDPIMPVAIARPVVRVYLEGFQQTDPAATFSWHALETAIAVLLEAERTRGAGPVDAG